jgi:O-antigen ligase
MSNNKRLNSIIKSKKRLINSLFFWTTVYLISGQIIHKGMNLTIKISLPLICLVLYINYLAYKIRLRDCNNEMLDLVLFNNSYRVNYLFKNIKI